METNRRELLLEILFVSTASEAEKDDSVIDLADFDDDEIIQALVKASNNNNVSDKVKGSCGESLAHIWLRRQDIDYDLLLHLNGIALTEVLSVIKNEKVEWYENYMQRKTTPF
ncbi:hypothetical protein A3842_22650 [Paenibacillus sp. P3E]|uniref:hypothetical protein n=1 Tax=Paenibacillus sp. P3E TaxID=1349435 RepID=UPI0009392163|nr:hypothetical protein [Paenibacillus sp. P3E]OKP72604.1 hypothetical protein A3842_22650 [Paenibacillus sp. P3E]